MKTHCVLCHHRAGHACCVYEAMTELDAANWRSFLLLQASASGLEISAVIAPMQKADAEAASAFIADCIVEQDQLLPPEDAIQAELFPRTAYDK